MAGASWDCSLDYRLEGWLVVLAWTGGSAARVKELHRQTHSTPLSSPAPARNNCFI
jgi:hypothetical protein